MILLVLKLQEERKNNGFSKYSNNVAEGQKPLTLYTSKPRSRNDGIGNGQYNADTLGSDVRKTGSQAPSEERLNENASATQAEQIPDGSTKSNILTEQSRDSNSEPLDAGVAETGGRATGTDGVSSSVSDTSGNGAQGTIEPVTTGVGTPSATRENANAGSEPSTADDKLTQFEITEDIARSVICLIASALNSAVYLIPFM